MARVVSIPIAIAMALSLTTMTTFAQSPPVAPNAAATTVPPSGPLQLVGRRPEGAGVQLGPSPLPGETLPASPPDIAAEKRARGSDAEFLRHATQVAMLQHELGLVEAARGKRSPVRQFAMLSAQRFDRMKAKLEFFASEFLIPLTTMPSRQVLTDRQWLDGAPPVAVDRDYLNRILPATSAEIRFFDAETRAGKISTVVNYARTVLPWLKRREQISAALARSTRQTNG